MMSGSSLPARRHIPEKAGACFECAGIAIASPMTLRRSTSTLYSAPQISQSTDDRLSEISSAPRCFSPSFSDLLGDDDPLVGAALADHRLWDIGAALHFGKLIGARGRSRGETDQNRQTPELLHACPRPLSGIIARPVIAVASGDGQVCLLVSLRGSGPDWIMPSLRMNCPAWGSFASRS